MQLISPQLIISGTGGRKALRKIVLCNQRNDDIHVPNTQVYTLIVLSVNK